MSEIGVIRRCHALLPPGETQASPAAPSPMRLVMALHQHSQPGIRARNSDVQCAAAEVREEDVLTCGACFSGRAAGASPRLSADSRAHTDP